MRQRYLYNSYTCKVAFWYWEGPQHTDNKNIISDTKLKYYWIDNESGTMKKAI